MIKEKTRLVISVISIALILLIVIQLFIDNTDIYFFDSLEEGGTAVPLFISIIFISAASIINLIKRKSESKGLFVIIGSLYSLSFIFSILSERAFVLFGIARGLHYLTLLALGYMAFNLFCAIRFVVLAMKQKKKVAYLTKCPLCNHDVSSEAKKCPNCGNKC